MMFKKYIPVFFVGLLFMTTLKAQTIEEGMNNLYAKRDKAAIEVFQKLIDKNKKIVRQSIG